MAETDLAVAMEIKIKLLDVKPATSRTLRVPLGLRYDQLHVLIQLAFGWENEHLYAFQPYKQDVQYMEDIDPLMADLGTPAELSRMNYVYPDLVKGPVMYTYDFGQNWEHEVTLNKVLTFSELGKLPLPSCLTGRGNNRLEDSDGELGAPYDRQKINDRLELWSRAGDQLILADDMGLAPHADD